MMLRSGSKNQFYTILRDIEENKKSTDTVDFSYFTKTDEQQRKACVKLGYIKENDTNNNFIDLFIQLLQDRSGDIAQCITLHKIFVEDYLKPDDIIVRRAANAAKVQSLAYLCLLALQKNNIWELADDFLFILRPCSQFSPFNRGRIQTGKSSRTDDFGITEKEDCPEWAANWHYTPIFPAKDEFEPDMNSTTIRFFNKHQIPFIAGPSGTAANCLRGVLLLLPLSPGEIKEYLNLIAAAEIAQGNHSFYEVVMIGTNLKIFHKLEACNDHVSISAVPKINMRNLYADCLTDEVKNCADYQALAEEYPDYLPETSSLHELKRKRL